MKKIEKLAIELPQLFQHFDIHSQVGEGTFSSVYVASLKGNPQKKFAVKHMVRTCHPDRIKIELDCLKKIGGVDNVAGIDFCLRSQDTVVFVMPYLRHKHFNDYVGKMDAKETALYMKNLLMALARVHDFNVIHRDVKPSNFLYDRKGGRFLLVDFGLAQEGPGKVELKRKRAVSSSEESTSAKRVGYNGRDGKVACETKVLFTSGDVTSQKENFPVFEPKRSLRSDGKSTTES